MINNAKLTTVITQGVTDMGCEFVGLEVENQGKKRLFRIFADAADGITVKQLQDISKHVDSLLNVEFPDLSDMILEVSSPGLDRRLFTSAHFVRFKGHEVKIRLKQAISGQRNFVGIIEQADEKTVTLKVEDQLLELNLEQIDKARLVPNFSKAQ